MAVRMAGRPEEERVDVGVPLEAHVSKSVPTSATALSVCLHSWARGSQDAEQE